MLVNFRNMCLSLSLKSNQQIFSLCKTVFLLHYSVPELGEKIAYLLILVLVQLRDRCESVLLVRAEHLALAARRPMAVLAEIVQRYSVLSTTLKLLASLQKALQNCTHLAHKASALRKRSFEGTTTVGTLGSQAQADSQAAFAEQLGAMRAEGGLHCPAVTYLAAEQLLQLLPALLQFASMRLSRRWFHYKLCRSFCFPTLAADEPDQTGREVSHLLLELYLHVFTNREANIHYLSLFEVEVVSLDRKGVLEQLALPMYHDLLSMEIHPINQKLLISARLLSAFSLPNAFLFGLDHDAVRSLGANAEVIDVGWFQTMRFVHEIDIMWAVLLLCLLAPASPRCFSNYNIKHSREECSFHYAAEDCQNYAFSHCEYFVNTTTYWLWIFRDEVRAEFINSTDIAQCGEICCNGNITLPVSLEGYRVCQEHKFLKEVQQTSAFELLVQVGLMMFLISVVCSILYAIYQSIERHLLELQAQPREIEMRLL